MTLSEQMFLDRLKAIRAPKRANIGIGGSPAGAGAAAGVPITADQGPLPDGGNLGQQMPNMQSGVVPGRNRFTIGNSARGNIDLGSFMSARPNQDALAQLAQNPLAEVDPYKATTGVGGFFRRLLGDDANERNAALAEQQGQLRLQKWLMDQQAQSRMGVLDKQHQYEMERLKAASDKEAENIKYRTQLDLQAKQLENQWAVDNAGKLAKQQATSEFDKLTGIVGDPIVAAQLQEQILRAPIAKLMADAAASNARAQGSGAFAPKPVAPERWRSEGGLFFKGDSGPFANEDGQFVPVGMAPPPQDMNAINEATRRMVAAKKHETTMAGFNAEPTVIGGLKALGGEAMQGALDLGKSAAKMTFPNVEPAVQAAKEAYNPIANWLKEKARIEQDRKRKIYESQNPQLFQ